MRRQKQEESGRGLQRAVALGVVVGAQFVCAGQTMTIAVTPAADAFMQSLAPGNNYGAAGALSVSGAAAVNGSGQQNGLFDTLIRFPTSGAASAFDGTFGSNDWVVTGAALVLNELGAPPNLTFNRGVGAFEVRWLASDTWVEGTGTPATPTTDGVAYQDLPSILNPAADVSLGRFTNSGVNGLESFTLVPVSGLASNVAAGTDVNFYLTAASDWVGFTFNSRNFTGTNSWPSLEITGAAKPPVRIGSIERVGTNQIALRFNTASNWTYVVQWRDGSPGAAAGAWSNLFTVSAKPLDDQAVVVQGVTNEQRFYRLVASP